MKRNKLFILGICTVMVALVSLSLVSVTWAKYTSSISGEDQARVAKWSVLFEDKDAATESSFTVDLFGTIKDTDGSAESDVSSANLDKVIAPGTQGSFEFNLENKSEVTAAYAVDFTVTNANNIPVQFRIADGEWKNSIDDLDIPFDNSDAPTSNPLAAKTGTASFTIEWRWIYNGVDSTDTALGTAGTATIKVEVDVTFTQVD